MEYAKIIAQSDIVPKDFKGKPGNVLVAVQMGAELGLPPMQALQNIAVINGRPSVWGDAMLALIRAHHSCEYVIEEFEDATMTAICKAKRRGNPEQVLRFSKADAETAKLWGKEGPWKQYPKRMLQMRSRGFALRDVWPDVLRGIISAEEAQDYQEAVVVPTPKGRGADVSTVKKTLAEYAAEVDATETVDDLNAWYKDNVKSCQKDLSAEEQKELLSLCAKRKEELAPKLETCTDELFAELAKEWEPLVRGGKKKAKAIIATAKTSMILTDEQQMQIAAWEEEGA
jgi:hypothetical protein